MEYKTKVFSFRMRESMYRKLQYIAAENDRSMNMQLENIVKIFIKDYEKIKGKIDLENSENDDE